MASRIQNKVGFAICSLFGIVTSWSIIGAPITKFFLYTELHQLENHVLDFGMALAKAENSSSKLHECNMILLFTLINPFSCLVTAL